MTFVVDGSRALRIEGSPLPTLKSLDTEGRVVSLDSFSKIMAHGAPFFATTPHANHARFNFSAPPEVTITSGMTRLGELLTECLPKAAKQNTSAAGPTTNLLVTTSLEQIARQLWSVPAFVRVTGYPEAILTSAGWSETAQTILNRT